MSESSIINPIVTGTVVILWLSTVAVLVAFGHPVPALVLLVAHIAVCLIGLRTLVNKSPADAKRHLRDREHNTADSYVARELG